MAITSQQGSFFKVVLQALTMYAMLVFLFPKQPFDNTNKLLKKFLWENKVGKNGINWVRWTKLCEKKS